MAAQAGTTATSVNLPGFPGKTESVGMRLRNCTPAAATVDSGLPSVPHTVSAGGNITEIAVAVAAHALSVGAAGISNTARAITSAIDAGFACVLALVVEVATDDDRFALQLGVEDTFDRYKKRIQIKMRNASGCVALVGFRQHSFSSRSTRVFRNKNAGLMIGIEERSGHCENS